MSAVLIKYIKEFFIEKVFIELTIVVENILTTYDLLASNF